MTSTSKDLVTCKNELQDVLGDMTKTYETEEKINIFLQFLQMAKKYLDLLRSWFKLRISREDFDHEARQLLSDDTGAVDHPPVLKKKKEGRNRKRVHSSSSPRQHFQRFVPVNPLLHAPPASFPDVDDRGLTFANRELLLPDVGMVHGRMIVCAWDYGLDGVEDNAVKLLLNSIEVALKNILTALCNYRSPSLTREGCFRYNMGTSLPHTRSRVNRNTDYSEDSHSTIVTENGLVPNMRPTIECAERNAAMTLASSNWPTPNKYPISLFDMFNALQMNKSAIPSHAVYATNMERISNKLWHPSQDELDQETIRKQEIQLKEEYYNQS